MLYLDLDVHVFVHTFGSKKDLAYNEEIQLPKSYFNAMIDKNLWKLRNGGLKIYINMWSMLECITRQ